MDTRQITMKWLQKASEIMEAGEQILFPVDSRQDQKDKKKLFLRELKILAKVDPVAASQLQIYTKFEDHRLWVIVRKIAFSPFIAFKQNKDGSVERITMEDDSEKLRRLRLMKDDGYTLRAIEKIEGKLSDEEKEYLEREER